VWSGARSMHPVQTGSRTGTYAKLSDTILPRGGDRHKNSLQSIAQTFQDTSGVNTIRTECFVLHAALSVWRTHANPHAPNPSGPSLKLKSTGRSFQIREFSKEPGAQTVESAKIRATYFRISTCGCRSTQGQLVHKVWAFNCN
jgi:hypothetical protein